MKKTLLIMAAGMGSRYGTLKQMDPVGPQREVLLDYSLYDAWHAGFERIVFVVRQSFAEAFQTQVGARVSTVFDVAYAFQEMDVALGKTSVPKGRAKPWGTGHAVLAARELIDAPFVVINADDFYGGDAFTATEVLWEPGQTDYVFGGYQLGRTLSDHGQVCRGICRCDGQGYLREIAEYTGIRRKDGSIVGSDPQGNEQALVLDAVTSMNFWGFTPDIFDYLDGQFQTFLQRQGHTTDKEFYLPAAVDQLIQAGKKRVKVLPVAADWFGITYPQDKARVQTEIRTMIAEGLYPENLWSALQTKP